MYFAKNFTTCDLSFILLTIPFAEQKFLVLIKPSQNAFSLMGCAFFLLCFTRNSLPYCMRPDLNTILNRCGERRHPGLVLHFRGKTLNLSPLSKVLAVGFGQKYIKLWKSLITSVLTAMDFFFSLIIWQITLIDF